jgi:hypothetical protein
MNTNDKELLDKALLAMRADEPETQAILTSAQRVSRQLGIELNHEAFTGAIRNCESVQQLLPAHRAGTLPEARALLVDSHLRDCGICLRLSRQAAADLEGPARLDWSAPRIVSARRIPPQVWSWGFALSLALLVSAFFVYRAYWQVPPGVRAQVVSIDGAAYLISDAGDRQLTPGSELREGEQLRTSGDSRAVLRLSDGSVVEMNQRSNLAVGARGHNMTVALDKGDVIVQAAHRTSGHLYVKTPDCRVAVTGTVFSVDSGIKGSRVAVLQGSVQVAHAGIQSMLRPGQQLSTTDNLAAAPLDQQFAWSADRQKYIGILAQLALVQHQIAQIPFPQPRYSSDLLARVPAGTLLYVSIPNLGDFLSQANAIFQNQLNQSPELQQWWAAGHAQNTDELNQFVGKIHDVSQYLGDEVVIVGYKQTTHPGFAVIADITRSGLAAELQQFTTPAGGLIIYTEQTLATASSSGDMRKGGYALVRDHEVVFSGSVAGLKQIDTQLNAGASGFSTGDFGKQISAAYDRGAGIILAANLHEMMASGYPHAQHKPAHEAMLNESGMEDLRYLIAEHREMNGVPSNHLNLQFAGTRQRVASWLASPAPIGSLDFVSANAAVAVATLTKDPAAIADDIIAMASASNGAKLDLNEIDSKLQISVRNDIMANLDGDFLVALDGPVLPMPAWKAVIGVNNAGSLENALERLTTAANTLAQGSNSPHITIEPSDVNGQRYYALRNTTSGTVLANYTFSSGFMIVAPERALLIEALQTHTNGNSLGRSASFRALLPKDDNENYSAVAYQNLSPVLTPVLSQFDGQAADAIRKLAADSKPTIICAWGKDTRIEAASDSRLFGFDFLTLGALLDSQHKGLRNNSAGQSVKD